MTEFRLKLRDAKDRPATIAEHRALIEEIERLRAALEEIASHCIDSELASREKRGMAIRALKESQ